MTETSIHNEPRRHKVTLEYCVPCDHGAQAIRVAEELLTGYQHVFERLVLVISSKGEFEVKVDGKLLHGHPVPGEMLQMIRELVGPKYLLAIDKDLHSCEQANHPRRETGLLT